MISRKTIGPLLLAIIAIFIWVSAWASEPVKVAIIPFKMNADRDLSFLRDGIVDMLTTRLSWPDKVLVVDQQATAAVAGKTAGAINEKAAKQIGEKLRADYVLFGSLTVFGQSVSLDARMIDVHGVKPVVTIFDQSQGMDSVVPKVNAFAADINSRIFGRVVSAPSQPQPRATGSATAPDIYAHPEKLLGTFSEPEQIQTSGLNPNFVSVPGRGKGAGFWKSRKFDKYVKAMAIGDVNGDGNQEVVFVSQNDIFVYRSVNRRFVKVKEIAGEPKDSYISVDVADINRNGKAEVFVTNLNTVNNKLESFVLEWKGKNFERLTEGDNWYYRVVELPARGPVLFGQKRGVSDLFLRGIKELDWRNGQYEAVDTVKLPRSANVFAFTLGDAMNNGKDAILVFNEDDYLHIYTSAGSREWKSDEHYGGSLNYLDIKGPTGDMERGELEENNRVYLAQRIFIKDLDRNGKQEVIVTKNQGSSSRTFKRYRNFTRSEIVSLSWDGMGLALNWKTRKIHGYVSDFAIADVDNDGQEELVASVVTSKGANFLVKPKSVIISYDLAVPKT